ncbi:hypothetical protein FUAX_24400 [Fulvitalea axinellae]|uniref:Uncharacterized protein n=1 Tax=Fulvitalea axinellae TaxID=1182444 RepID=A0AAU9CPM0_9BACT|nr:hypothetical protein FUAX_24400 [Fulvitalea axinellae]
MYKGICEIRLFHGYYNRYVGDDMVLEPVFQSSELMKQHGIFVKRYPYGLRLCMESAKLDVLKTTLDRNPLELYFYFKDVQPYMDMVSKLELRTSTEYHYFEPNEVESGAITFSHKKATLPEFYEGDDTEQLLTHEYVSELKKYGFRVWGLVKVVLERDMLEEDVSPSVFDFRIEGRAVEWRYRIVDTRGKFDQMQINVPEWSDVKFGEHKLVKLVNGIEAKEFRSEGRRSIREFDDLVVTLEMFWLNERTKRRVAMELPRPECEKLKCERVGEEKNVFSTVYVYV